MDIGERTAMMQRAFAAHFGTQPTVWTRAPGRVDLMGSHTDYNMGYVMTMTIDHDTWIAARPRADGTVRVRSLNIAGESSFSLESVTRDAHAPWSNYVRGVAVMLQQAGYTLTGFDGLIHSTVPFGSGLSSSAALEMATAVLFRQIGGFALDSVKMALLGQKAENDFVGVSTGILDQYSSAMGEPGSAIQLDCRHLTSHPVPIGAGLQVVICDTRAQRNLVGSEYDERRAGCEEGVRLLQQVDPTIKALRDVPLDLFAAHEARLPPTVARRCRFIIEENQRVLNLADVLPDGNADALRQLFAASYTGARDLFEIGAPAMASMMNAMLAGPGIVAARQAGAGFGGCMVALVQERAVDDFSHHVVQQYEAETGVQPHVFAVTASAGAEVLDHGA